MLGCRQALGGPLQLSVTWTSEQRASEAASLLFTTLGFMSFESGVWAVA